MWNQSQLISVSGTDHSVQFQATLSLENQNRRSDSLTRSIYAGLAVNINACVCVCVCITSSTFLVLGLFGRVGLGGRSVISSGQGALVLIGRLETLGCLPRRSNEKPWPPPVSKVAKPYCNCTLSNGVSHASAPASVMTITIMLLRSLGASPSRR